MSQTLSMNSKAGYTLIVKYAKTITKNKKYVVEYFASLFSYFVPGSAFVQKVKGLCGLFFHGINKTRNSHEIRKVYSECFVFRGVFRRIATKCEIRKVCG